jgi:hypothetical protein
VIRPRTSPTTPPTQAVRRGTGRFGSTVFFLLWCAIAAGIFAVMARQALGDLATRGWTAAPCRIVDSGVSEESGERYAFNVRYSYAARPASAVESAPRTGTTYARGYKGDADYAPAQRLLLRYPPGARATCYVDPYDPSRAVLERPWPPVVFMLPVPLLFVLIGVGALWATSRRPTPGAARPDAPLTAGAAGPRRGARVALLFFGAFFVIGGAVLVVAGRRVVMVPAARSWKPLPATVVSSGVRAHRGDETTYSVNILYAYTVEGHEYRSNRYGFMGGSGGYDGKRDIVRRYPPGTHFTAYVNPSDPVEAVVERGLTTDMLVLLVPLFFVAVGAGGIYFSVRAARPPRGAKTTRPAAPLAGRYVPSARSAPRAGRLNAGRFPLKPHQSPGLKLFGLTVIALFWNGIVSVFVYQAYKGWATGRHDVCLTLFMVPFVGVGVALVAGALHALLALFNPRCELTADRDTPALGDTLDLRWTFSGRGDAIHRLVLRVEGREEATYRRGTDTYTDKNVFYARGLLDTTRPAEVRAGGTKWTVPPDTMHSFTAPNNRVVWVLCLHGHIAGRPDVKEEYVLAVAPLPLSRVGARAAGSFGPSEAGAPRAAPPNTGEGASWT